MTNCPYTWAKRVSNHPLDKANLQIAEHLRVRVTKNKETTVDVALPAHSARWLMELIPDDVLNQICREGIPIEKIQDDLSKEEKLFSGEIFTLTEAHRIIEVWLQ